MSVAAALAFALFSLSSCITINSGAALAEKSVIGPKMGEAKSTIILGLWSSKGEENNIQQAAKNIKAAGVQKDIELKQIRIEEINARSIPIESDERGFTTRDDEW